MYDAVMWPFERAAVGAWRRRLAAAARGRVLEIGSGTGAQLRWYAPGAEVTALEPDEGMRARLSGARSACERAGHGRRAGAPRTCRSRAASFDTAVSAFALCTVSDPAAALAELRRVLVPGGTLLLLEHVHLTWEPGRALQTAAAPAWAAVAGGCRLDRDTLRTAREVGFTLVRQQEHVAGWIVEAVLLAPAASGPETSESATLESDLMAVSGPA